MFGNHPFAFLQDSFGPIEWNNGALSIRVARFDFCNASLDVILDRLNNRLRPTKVLDFNVVFIRLRVHRHQILLGLFLLGFFLLLYLHLVALVVVFFLTLVSVNLPDWDFYILVVFLWRCFNVMMRL